MESFHLRELGSGLSLGDLRPCSVKSIFILTALVVSFQIAEAISIRPLAGVEVGWSIMNSEIKDLRGDSVPKLPSGAPNILENNVLWGGGLFCGVKNSCWKLTCYGNNYGILAGDKEGYASPGLHVD